MRKKCLPLFNRGAVEYSRWRCVLLLKHMKRLLLPVLVLAGMLAASHSQSAEAAKPKAETYTEPAKAGQDYVDQGEYVGDKLGGQVIALANDKFRLVLHKGGLPGAGWDLSPKTEIEGQREGGQIAFASKDGNSKATLANGTVTGVLTGGAKFSLKKTVRKSPTEGEQPPAGAIILFDGSNADAWTGAHVDDRKLLQAGTSSKQTFTNFTLHVEFLLPFKPAGRGQDRGNSGVYLQDRYEVQVLDSFGLKGLDNECGGIYTKAKPLVNMCYPPLTWQTYDIDFEAAKFDTDGKKTKNAVTTIKQNGVLIHDHREITGSTGGGKPESPAGGGIQLQGHGNPVFYRNIWIVPKA
jgi:hypothetical protein